MTARAYGDDGELVDLCPAVIPGDKNMPRSDDRREKAVIDGRRFLKKPSINLDEVLVIRLKPQGKHCDKHPGNFYGWCESLLTVFLNNSQNIIGELLSTPSKVLPQAAYPFLVPKFALPCK